MNISVEDLSKLLEDAGYIPSREIVTALYLAIKLEKPLLVEGEPGCGKTELAKALARALRTELIRLQCYEGLDASKALYDWNYPRQLITIRLLENREDPRKIEEEIYSEKYLLKRPLLRALLHEGPIPPVLLIDEVDRADEEFEALLLEFLSEFQVTIPELGTVRAKVKPIVILTSNRTREVGDGLKRRSLYLYLTYPDKERELRIVKSKVDVSDELAREIVDFVNELRKLNILKKPGISETIEWARALRELGVNKLGEDVIRYTLPILVKNIDDLRIVEDYLRGTRPGPH